MQQNKIKQTVKIYIPILVLAVIIFWAFYGFTPLDVTNDAWIMNGYDESDLIQHYAGWVHYRNSDWSFPLGRILNMAEGTGTMISYTDCIPLVAVICKLFRSVLPETFQYFGWYTLLCFFLQGVAGYHLVRRKSSDYAVDYLGSILFMASPVLIERAFRHTALGSQWLILFAFLIYLNEKDRMSQPNSRRKPLPWIYVLLNVLCILIHPYFLPLVFLFTAMTAFEQALKYHCYIRNICYLIGTVIAVFAAGWLVGVVGWGETSGARFGYGYFSMNLNALFNPTSLGGYQWSSVIPQLGQTQGNYDGFNYLGLGVILLFFAVFIREGYQILVKRNFKRIKKYWLLLLVFVALTAFAVTNIICLNDKILLQIPIPDGLYWRFGIFRSSGRMFYPVYYCIVLMGIYFLIDLGREKLTRILLLITVAVQLADLGGVIVQKHIDMEQAGVSVSVLDETELNDLVKNCRKVDIKDLSDIVKIRKLAVWAGKNGMATSFSVAVAETEDYTRANQIVAEEMELLENGTLDPGIVYVTQYDETFRQWVSKLDESMYKCYYYDDCYFLIPESGKEN